MPRYIDAELIDFGTVFIGDSDFATDCRNYANDAVDAVHTADVAPVIHGRWITVDADNPYLIHGECSECGFKQTISDHLNFCPNCGAKMDGKEETR